MTAAVETEGAVWAVVVERSGPPAEMAAFLVAEAARLADQLDRTAEVVLLGGRCDEALIGAVGARGAARIFLARGQGDSPLQADSLVPVLADLMREHRPAVVLWGRSALERELASRVAAWLGTGLASDCFDINATADGTLRLSRAAYGGRASCTVACRQARPQMATLKPRPAPSGPAAPASRQPEVVPVEVCSNDSAGRAVVTGCFQEDPLSMDLAEADVIVAGGRGVGGREGFDLLGELASLLGGAVAASRVAVDAGWVAPHRQVGQSGRTVAPTLYIACGISGAFHHLVGMRESRTVIAVNRDRNAPIFALADLGIVGDLHEVLPPVVARLRESKTRGPLPGEAVLDGFAEL